MCFDKSELISKEYGRIHHLPISIPIDANLHDVQLWHASGPMGNILFSEIKDENCSIWHCEYIINEDSNLTLQVPASSSISLSFTLKKNIHYQMKEFGKGFSRKNEYNMTFLPEACCEYNFTKGEYSSFGIEFKREYLKQLSVDNFPMLIDFIKRIDDNRAATISETRQMATSEMLILIQELLRFKHEGYFPKLYFKARVVELLRLSIENIFFAQSNPRVGLHPSDIKKLERVKEYLLNNLDKPGSLPEIARHAGLNEYKLKSGFKQLFGKPVYGFVHVERLGRARKKIVETGLPMKHIARNAGYKSLSNFTTAFRKLYGYPPGRLTRGTSEE